MRVAGAHLSANMCSRGACTCQPGRLRAAIVAAPTRRRGWLRASVAACGWAGLGRFSWWWLAGRLGRKGEGESLKIWPKSASHSSDSDGHRWQQRRSSPRSRRPAAPSQARTARDLKIRFPCRKLRQWHRCSFKSELHGRPRPSLDRPSWGVPKKAPKLFSGATNLCGPGVGGGLGLRPAVLVRHTTACFRVGIALHRTFRTGRCDNGTSQRHKTIVANSSTRAMA